MKEDSRNSGFLIFTHKEKNIYQKKRWLNETEMSDTLGLQRSAIIMWLQG